jgi:hypothetical protein
MQLRAPRGGRKVHGNKEKNFLKRDRETRGPAADDPQTDRKTDRQTPAGTQQISAPAPNGAEGRKDRHVAVAS